MTRSIMQGVTRNRINSRRGGNAFCRPQNDVAFKKIFGSEEHKEILISFLNAVLDLQGDKEIADELTTLLDKWVYFLKHATHLTDVPAHTDNPGLHSAYEVAERFRWSEEELEVYDYWSMKAQDGRGALPVAEQRGEQRGRQETALAMLADGLPVEMIRKYTGLSAAQVQSLRTPQSTE
ncbi:MAG: PD-(D/E)XK nuclease family transposase [Caldilineaceae bacterium]